MGSTHKTIYMPDIESLRIPLPSVDEQDELIDTVWKRLRGIDAMAMRTNVSLLCCMSTGSAAAMSAFTGEITSQWVER